MWRGRRWLRSIFRRSERTGYLYPLADQALVSASLFAASLALARLSSPSEFGPFAVARNIVVFIGMLQAALITRPLCVITNVIGDIQRKHYLASLSGLQAWFTLGSIFLASAWLTLTVSDLPIALSFTVLFFCVTYQAREYCRFHYLAGLRPRKAASQSGLYFIAVAFGLAALARGNSLSSVSTLVVLGTAGLIATARGNIWRDLWKRYNPRDALTRNLQYARWELVGSTANFIYIGAIPLFLSAIAKPDEAGGYAAAFTILGPIQVAVFGIYNALVPKAAALAAVDKDLAARHVRNVGLLLSGMSVAVVIPVLVASTRILPFVYNDSYERFAPTLQVLALYFIVFAISTSFHSLLLALRQPKAKAIAQLAGMSVALAVVAAYRSTLDARIGAATTLAAEVVVAIVAGALVWATVRAPDKSLAYTKSVED